MKHASNHLIESLTLQIRSEMAIICSAQHNSFLRDSHEGVKKFSWESIWLEFKAHVPTLYKLISGFLPKADDRFISFVIALLLKKRSKHMSLVQRVISTLLYGNSAKKQVSIKLKNLIIYIACVRLLSLQIFNCLQPLMVCMSAPVTSRIIDNVIDDYNVDVMFWADELKQHYKVHRMYIDSHDEFITYLCSLVPILFLDVIYKSMLQMMA